MGRNRDKSAKVSMHGNISNHKTVKKKLYSKDSPREPYFATFYHKSFECAEVNFGHVFEFAG